MLAGNYALISTSSDIAFVLEDPCAFLEIPYDIETYDIGLGFAKHSPYIGVFNYFIKKNIESGNMERIKNKWRKTNPKGLVLKELDSMGFNNVVSGFFMIIIGVTITVLFFCAELYIGSKQRVRLTLK